MSSSIRVALRIRPDLDEGEDEPLESSTFEGKNCIHVQDDTVSIRKHKKDGTSEISHQYTFDKVFDEDATQEEVFGNVVDLIDDGLKGFNATIFAFGMTGSGKTHTISGQTTGSGHAGIVPRAVHHVFSNLRGYSRENKDNVAMVFLTFVELYNNTFYDLLAPNLGGDDVTGVGARKDNRNYDAFGSSTTGSASSNGGLRLQEHPGRGMTLVGSSSLRVPVTSAEETLNLIEKGYKLRATGSTNLNERSSRSHTVLSLEVLTRNGVDSDGPTITKIGKINLVDLAGSERVKVSGATGQTLTEAKQINKALSVLGDVLNALSKRDESRDDNKPGKEAASAHIPYRNSKLTMLLKDSLGGNSKTMMIATVRQKAAFYQQTLTSMQYAARARHIKCSPTLNIADAQLDEVPSGPSMQKTLNEVSRLKLQLELRTNEYNEIKGRLEQAEQDKAKAVAQAMKKSAAEGALNAAVTAESQLRDQKIAEYKAMIDTLKKSSEAERKELQNAMKFVIHNHEGHLAMKEREFVSLEEKLSAEQRRAEALIRDKDDAIQSKKEMTSRNQALYQENIDLTRQIERLKMEAVSLKRALSQAEDRAAATVMSQADRDQFVEALQKLTVSRTKHKERADALEEQLLMAEKKCEDSKGVSDTLSVQLNKLGNKLLELEDKKEAYKAKTLEQDKLISAAVVRIKALESQSVAATSPNKEGTPSNSGDPPGGAEWDHLLKAQLHRNKHEQGIEGVMTDTAAASATSIVTEVTESAAKEISRLTLLCEQRETELSEYRAEVENTFAKSKLLVSSQESSRKDWKMQVEGLTEEIKRRDEALTKAEEARREAEQDHVAAKVSVESLQRQQVDLKASLQNARDSHVMSQQLLDSVRGELEASEKCNKEHERRIRELVMASAQAMKELATEREKHVSEMGVMKELHEQLKATNIALETQLNNTQSQVQELSERFEGRSAALSDTMTENLNNADQISSNPEPEEKAKANEKENGILSPASENRVLKSAISALKQQEKVMFFTLEDKLRDLDAARNKLVMLKKQSERAKSDNLLQRLRRDVDSEKDEEEEEKSRRSNAIMERMLNKAQQDQEKAQVRLLTSEHSNKELQIRLDSAQNLLEKERQLNRELTEELANKQVESEQEIERLTALVKKTIDANQLRRSHELEHLDSRNTSLDSNVSQSPDRKSAEITSQASPSKAPMGVIPEGGGGRSEILGADAVSDDESDLDYFDVASEPAWLDNGDD